MPEHHPMPKLAVIGAMGQAEREAMLERQREGIAKAKREGRYKGRVPTARRKADEIIRLKEEGVRPSEIRQQVGDRQGECLSRVGSTECRTWGDGLISLIDASEPFPGLQHAFLAWLVEGRSRLAVAIKVGCSTPDVTEFGFASTSPILAGSLATCGDLVISADWEGACWDFLFSEEVRPEKSHGGFVCAICEQRANIAFFRHWKPCG